LTRVPDIFFVSDLSVRNALRATIPAAAAQLGVTIVRIPVRNEVEIEPAISALAAEPNGGLLLTGAPVANAVSAILRPALHYHLPLMFGGGVGAAGYEGVLMAHGQARAPAYARRHHRRAAPGNLSGRAAASRYDGAGNVMWVRSGMANFDPRLTGILAPRMASTLRPGALTRVAGDLVMYAKTMSAAAARGLVLTCRHRWRHC
jgi:hypothetical protein